MQTAIAENYAKCRRQISKLKEYLSSLKSKEANNILTEIAKQKAQNKEGYTIDKTWRIHKKLKFHQGKVYSLCWSQQNPNLILSAAQDGTLIISSRNDNRRMVKKIILRSSHTLDCHWSPSGQYLASAGLDNTCTIWNISSDSGKSPFYAELAEHEGHITSCKFIDDNQIITGSNDCTIRLWDINKQCTKMIFSPGRHDVMSIALNKEHSSFVSVGSNDCSVYVYDYRLSTNHKWIAKWYLGDDEYDLSDVRWFPDMNSFGVAGDSRIFLLDMKCRRILNTYDIQSSGFFTCLDFSKSGYYLFGGLTSKPYISIFNTISGELEKTQIECDQSRMTCLETSPDGCCVAAGAWDNSITMFL